MHVITDFLYILTGFTRIPVVSLDVKIKFTVLVSRGMDSTSEELTDPSEKPFEPFTRSFVK